MTTPGGFSDERIHALKQFIAKMSSCWSIDDNPRHVRNYSVNIPHNNKPVVDRLRPYTAEEVKIWKQTIDKLLKEGTVEESTRPDSYTHLRSYETKANLVCRLLLE